MKTLNNKVICYYQSLGPNNRWSRQSFELIKLWEKSWKKHGWDTIVLNKKTSESHPRFKNINIHNLKSNLYHCTSLDHRNPAYVKQLCLRWYAYASFSLQNIGTIWADYDVMNYGLTPEHLYEKLESRTSCRFCNEFACGYLSVKTSDKIINAFERIYHAEDISQIIAEMGESLNSKWRSRPDIVDMYILSSYAPMIIRRLCCTARAYDFNAPEKDSLPLIHFHGGFGANPKTKQLYKIPKGASRAGVINFLKPIT